MMAAKSMPEDEATVVMAKTSTTKTPTERRVTVAEASKKVATNHMAETTRKNLHATH
jgi:hypothetical protein